MNNSPIEDIVIENRNINKAPKKGRGILVILVFLIILLAGLCALYIYIKNNPIIPIKQVFFESISNADFKFYTDNEVYSELLNKYGKNNSQTDTNLSFSTTMELPEELADVDISKFALNFSVANNVNTSESLLELGLSYSDNELLKLKAVNNKNQFAWFSEEIVNKYVGVNKANYEKIQEKINTDEEQNEENSNLFDQLKYISNKEIELDKNAKIQEYKTYISNSLLEEKFSSQSNYVLERENAENVNVTAYSLNLTSKEYNELVKNILTKLKDDELTISQIVTGEESNSDFTVTATPNLDPVGTEDEEVVNALNIPSEINVNETTDTENTDQDGVSQEQVENEQPTESVEQVDNAEEQNQETNTNLQNETTQNTVTNTTTSEENSTNTVQNTSVEEILNQGNKNANIDTNQILIALLFNRKLECTVQDFQRVIEKYLNEIEEYENNFTLTVYVSETATEKIHVSFPDLSTIDMEFVKEDENEKSITLTYLYEEDGIQYGEDNAVIYSAADNSVTQQVPIVTEKQTNGFKLEFYKLKNDASTKIKATYNFIENKEINKKLSINLTTDGTVSSKNFENDITITYSTNDGEFKTNIENQIKFGTSVSVESLNDENCLFLDTLSDEELVQTITAIDEQIDYVYNSKKESLNFIDTNTQTSLIQETPSLITRDEAKGVLIETISGQMTEAYNRGEAYTIENVANLQIEGHQVTVSLENGFAIVTVDGYKFAIDSEFGLTDVE